MRRGSFRKKTYEEVIKTRSVKPKKTYRQAKASKEKKRYGIKIWSVEKADREFSLWLRAKVGKCEKCGTTEGLTNSHYIGRREYATRFDPDNCDVLCFSCHSIFEPRKQYEYRDWKIAKMGAEAEAELSKKKLSYKGSIEAIRDCMALLGKIPLSQ